jgi:hypothetical protein
MNEPTSSLHVRGGSKDVAEYLCILAGSLLGWTMVAATDAFRDAGTLTLRSIGGSKGNILLGVAIGLPLGSVAGLIVARRAFVPDARLSPARVAVAAAATVGSLVVGVAALDFVSSQILWLLPAVASAACQFGYRWAPVRRSGHHAP